MEPLEFLEVVLPSAGFYCITELTTNKKEKAMADTIAGLSDKLREFNNAQYDTFTAMASFKTGNSRLSTNALHLRCFFIDIDCNHPKDIAAPEKAYASAKEAVAALHEFLAASGMGALGTPWLNHSGGGVHAYWPFTSDIPADLWKVDAENLKRLCKQHGLRIDMGVTADIARIMRVPGTTNSGVKGGKQVRAATRVRQMEQGDVFEFDALHKFFAEKLNGHAYQSTELQLLGPRPSYATDSVPVFAKEVSAFGSTFKKIALASAGGEGCAQVTYYFNHAQEDGMEPLWRGVLSLAKHCDDSEKAARVISEAHPYDAERTAKKVAEIKGPYPCIKFDSENPGVCTECAHWGKTTSTGKPYTPLLLGCYTKVDDVAKKIHVSMEAGAPIVVDRPTTPFGYHYAATGGILYDDYDKHTKTSSEVSVLQYDMYLLSILNSNKVHEVQMLAHRPEGATVISIPMRSVGAQDEMIKCLASQNVVAGPYSGALGDRYLWLYVKGCVTNFSSQRGAMNVPDGLGWQDDASFVLNDKVYFTDGKVEHVPMRGMENLVRNMRPVGTLDGWKRYVNMLLAKGLTDHVAFGMTGFASPLMKYYKGLYGMTFHACSTISGSGKSMAMDMAASVWGHPHYYRTGAGTSEVAMQQRLGLLRSLPLLSDEITSKHHKTPEWLPEFLLGITQGRGKERMESGTNKERINTSTWATLCAISSNTHGMDYLSGGRSHSSHGEIYRFLEWSLDKELFFTEDERKIIQSLVDNNGVAGELWAKWLVANGDTAEKVALEVYSRIELEFDMSGAERYWTAGVAAWVAAAIMVGSNYANIIDLPVEKIMNFGKRLIDSARAAELSSHKSADDLLNEYTKEFYGQMVFVNDNVMSINGENLVDRTSTRTKVMGRVEHKKGTGFVDYYLSTVELKMFCTTKSFGYADFIRDVKLKYKCEEGRMNLLEGVKGPIMRVHCLKISMSADAKLGA